MSNLYDLKKYFLKYKRKLIWGFVFIILSNIATVYIPILLKDSIDSIKKGIDSAVVIRYALLIVITSAISGVFRYMIRQTIIVVSRNIEYDLRQDFWSHIQDLSLRYFQNNSTGNIMAHATNDINAVRMFIGPAVMYSTDTGLRLLIVLGIMFSLNIELTLYSLIPLPILSYLVYKLGKKIHVKFTRIQEKFSELTTKAQENFSGIRVIKSYVREEEEINDFRRLSDEYFQKNMDMIKIQSLFQPVLFLITGGSIIIVVWLGGQMVINGILTLGEISAFVMYLGLLTWPMIAFGWVVNIIQQASASMKRLNNILAEKYEITDNTESDKNMQTLHGEIEFKDVSFRYAGHLPEVLRTVNIKITRGSTVAIIGRTGSGKTTMINLISRLYDVTEGQLLIGGKNIKDIPLSILRKNIGLVPQETFLFSETLSSNILYGLDNHDEEIVKNVSAIAQLSKDVENFPLGYETILGERGITLSGGQKQRACLARALAIDPEILILDDSFSAVDTNTEEEILKRLREFMRERTSIIISHRISTVKNADMIFVLDSGQIAEQGTHEELVELKGIYAQLHYKQLIEKELEELN